MESASRSAPPDLPAACRSGAVVDKQGLVGCLTSHGFSNAVTFQPANRFWEFQSIEFGLLIFAGIVLVGVAYWRVLSRDA